MLVEDDRVQRFIFESLARIYIGQEISFEVKSFEEPLSAMNYFKTLNQNGYPDVIIMDVHLPVMNGIRLVKEMSDLMKKEKFPKTYFFTTDTENMFYSNSDVKDLEVPYRYYHKADIIKLLNELKLA